TGEFGAIRPELRDPVHHWNREHGLGTGGLARRDERVSTFAGDGTRVADRFEVPVGTAVVGVQLPVIPARVVAAVAIDRTVQVRQRGGIAVCHAVDEWAD